MFCCEHATLSSEISVGGWLGRYTNVEYLQSLCQIKIKDKKDKNTLLDPYYKK